MTTKTVLLSASICIFGAISYANTGILPDSADFTSTSQFHANGDDTLGAKNTDTDKTVVDEANESIGAKWVDRNGTYRLAPDLAAQQLDSLRSDQKATDIESASLRAFRFDKYAGGTLQTLGLGIGAAGDLSNSQALAVLPEASAVWFLPPDHQFRWMLGAVYGYFLGYGKLLPLVGLEYHAPSGFQLNILLPVLIKVSWQTINRDRIGLLAQLDGKLAKIEPTAILPDTSEVATLQERDLKLAVYYKHKFAGYSGTAELGVRAGRRFEIKNDSGDDVISAANEAYFCLRGTF